MRVRLSSPFAREGRSEANACEAREGDQLFLRQTASPALARDPLPAEGGEAMQRPLVIPFQGKMVGRCGCACLRLLPAKDGAKRTRAKRGREIGCSFARRHPPALARDPLPAEGGEAMQRPLVIPFQGKVVGRCGMRLSSPFKGKEWGRGSRLSSPFQGKGDRGGWLLRVAKTPLRFENERSERADARDALRAGGARTIQISRSDTAECVHRQACISHELRKTFPAERHSLGVRGRGIDRRKRREIGAEPCRELQLLRVVARGTDPCLMRQRPLAQLA